MRLRSSLFSFPAVSKGFTLVELLVVISIIAVLALISLPSLSGLSRSGSMNQAVSGIASLLEQARTYAMARNTYVWVGFFPEAGSPQRLAVGVVAGTTGQLDDLASSAYAPVGKLRVYDNFSLRSISGLTGMASNGDDIGASQIGAFRQTVGRETFTFTQVLQFSPTGVATVLANSSSHWVWIGLQPTRAAGGADPNVAVFQVATLTGQVQVFRP